MSNASNENTESPPDGRAAGGISDEQLPEDLQPTDDNPLAQDPSEEEVERDKKDASGPALGNPEGDDDGQPEGEPPGAVPRAPHG